jgi:hypothetical protein
LGKKRKPAKHQHWQDYRASQPSTADGRTRVTLQDDTQADWIRKVNYAMSHKQRMKATCEFTPEERPKPVLSADNDQSEALLQSIINISRDIPGETARPPCSQSHHWLRDKIDVSAPKSSKVRHT